MRRLLFVCVLLLASCDVFRAGSSRPSTALSPREFVDVYVALAQATTQAEKARILRKHQTSEKEMQAFISGYAKNLPELSAVFDSVLARQSGEGPPTVPH